MSTERQMPAPGCPPGPRQGAAARPAPGMPGQQDLHWAARAKFGLQLKPHKCRMCHLIVSNCRCNRCPSLSSIWITILDCGIHGIDHHWRVALVHSPHQIRPPTKLDSPCTGLDSPVGFDFPFPGYFQDACT